MSRYAVDNEDSNSENTCCFCMNPAYYYYQDPEAARNSEDRHRYMCKECVPKAPRDVQFFIKLGIMANSHNIWDVDALAERERQYKLTKPRGETK